MTSTTWEAAARAGRAQDKAGEAKAAILRSGRAEELAATDGGSAALENARLAERLAGEAAHEAEAARRRAKAIADRIAEDYGLPPERGPAAAPPAAP